MGVLCNELRCLFECGKPVIQFNWYLLLKEEMDTKIRETQSPCVTTKAGRHRLPYEIQRELVLPVAHIGLLTSRTSRQYIAIVLSPAPTVEVCYSSHRSGM